MRAPFRIGLLGMGNVGGALARRLTDDGDRLARAAGRPIVLEAIAVARSSSRKAPAPIVTVEGVLTRPDLDGVVELIGGLDPAHTYISTALRAGRQVITANNHLIALRGPELARIGPLRFEASVASAIPIVEMLAETLAGDRVATITGILNGTTNAMLDAMAGGASYADALADAQRRGMAEADPSADVDGHNPAAKLAILIMLAFRRRVDPAQVERVGIRNLDRGRLENAAARNARIKLIAAATQDDDTINADVRPRLVPADAALAHIHGADNAIALEARYAGSLLLTGPGAGPDAAASAVVADLIRAARDVPAAAGAILSGLADEPIASVEPLGAKAPFPAAT